MRFPCSQFSWICCFFVLACISPAFSQIPLPGGEPASKELADRLGLGQKISTARMALGTGMTGMAERLLSEAYLGLPEADPRREEVLLDQVSALLAMGRAKDALEKIPSGSNGPLAVRWGLREAMAVLVFQDYPRTGILLGKLNPEALPAGDLAWYYYVAGHLECEAGDFDKGMQLLDKATALSISPRQRSWMLVSVYQRRVLAGSVDEMTLADLKAKTETYKGQKTGFRFAMEYVVALHKIGREAEALAVIDNQLKLLGQSLERDGFLLLMGMLSEPNSGRGILALQELLRTGKDKDLQTLGLHLLVQVWSDGGNSRASGQLPFLVSLLKDFPDHPLKGELLILQSQLAFDLREHSLAKGAAEAFLQAFPKSDQIGSVLHLLAGISILGNPPQYRTAATYLTRLRDMAMDEGTRSALDIQLADSLFLAGDFKSAALIYQSSATGAKSHPGQEILAYQWINSLIEAGELNDAQVALDKLESVGVSIGEHRWRAEWNLVSRMQRDGRHQEAFSRVREILKTSEEENPGGVPLALSLRFRWMEAFLALLVQGEDEAISLLDSLLEQLAAQDPGLESKLALSELKASTILLKARALLDGGKLELATPLLEELRSKYDGSDPAQRSYLLEAAYHFKGDDLVAAQRLAVKLADSYPENPLAPISLMQAAQYAEKRGGDTFFKESLKILERLTNQYPAHELYFFARLHQGHLFRKLNQFGNAQQIYTNLSNQHPDHPMIHLALVANADCHLARAAQDSGSLDIAANLLERIFLQPDLPPDVVVEAGYKLAFAHKEAGRPKQAQEVLGSILDRYLLNPRTQSAALGGGGRYWMSRSILELGSLLEDGKAPDEARSVYGLIEVNNLPGRSLASAKINQLGI